MLPSILFGAYFFVVISTTLAFCDPSDSPIDLAANLLLGLLWPFILTSLLIRRIFIRRPGAHLL